VQLIHDELLEVRVAGAQAPVDPSRLN